MPPGRPRLPVRRRPQIGPHQEIRPPEQPRPAPRAGQRALVDHRGPAPDGRRRRPGRIPGPGEVRHLPPVRAEPLEHRPLVLFAAPHQVLEAEVARVRRPQRPLRRPQVQLGQLLARQEVRDIARRHPHPALDDLHRPSPLYLGQPGGKGSTASPHRRIFGPNGPTSPPPATSFGHHRDITSWFPRKRAQRAASRSAACPGRVGRCHRRRRRRKSYLRYLIRPVARRTFLRHVCAAATGSRWRARPRRAGRPGRRPPHTARPDGRTRP